MNALRIATEKSDGKAMEILLWSGANFNAKQMDDATALHFAAIQGALKVVEVLFKAWSRHRCEKKRRQ